MGKVGIVYLFVCAGFRWVGDIAHRVLGCYSVRGTSMCPAIDRRQVGYREHRWIQDMAAKHLCVCVCCSVSVYALCVSYRVCASAHHLTPEARYR